jgi:hypothetical protein
MRRGIAALALSLTLLGAACSGDDSQAVNADAIPDNPLNAEVVDGQVGADNGAPVNGDGAATESLSAEELEAEERNNDGGTTTDGGADTTAADGSTTGGGTPPSTIPVLGVPAAPEGGGLVVDSDEVVLEAASLTEAECYIEAFGEQTDIDLLAGISGGIDLSNPELADAIALQSGFHPGPTLLAADSCLSSEARFEVAKNTPLLAGAGINREKLDCMWPALQIIGAELADGLTLEQLLTATPADMLPPLEDVVVCNS